MIYDYFMSSREKRLLAYIEEYRAKGRCNTGNTKWHLNSEEIDLFQRIGFNVKTQTYHDYNLRTDVEYQFISWS